MTTDENGTSLGTIKYYPYGGARSGGVPTDKKFTGQRLDETGLYYYGARYYDPEIGRFISADTIIPDPINPQAFNRYSYCINNPLKYIDPTGHQPDNDNGNWLYLPGVGWVDLSTLGGEEPPEDNQSLAPKLPLVNGEYRIVWGYISMKNIKKPIWTTPNTIHNEGSITLVNGFPRSKIEVDLNVSALTNDPDPSNPGYHIIPNSWSILIWEGK